MITEAMVSEGIRNGSIRFVKDPNSEHGTVCQIGDNWFCFGGETAEEMQPEEYLKAVPIEDVASEVFGVLDDFAWARDEFGDEYAYYEAYLRECAEQSPKMKVERAIEILDPEHRELYDSIEPVNEACRMGMEALKKIADGRLVEVVRCKDCIYRNHVTKFCHMHSQETADGMYWEQFPDNHFCSDGEMIAQDCEEVKE